MRILLSLTMIFLVTTSVMSMDKEENEGKTSKPIYQQIASELPEPEISPGPVRGLPAQSPEELALEKELATARRVPMPRRKELMRRLDQVSRLEDVVLEGLQHYDIRTLPEKAKKES